MTTRGLTTTTNPMGFRAIRLHYTADPQKDPLHSDPEVAERAGEWLDAQRKIYPDPNDWDQEMEVSFWVSKGRRVYPQFRHEIHCRSITLSDRRLMYRAWDFGWHTPVCLVGQSDGKDRLLIGREIVGREQTTFDFAKDVVRRCAEWYPYSAAGYEDFCDPAGQQVKSIENERNERRDIDILVGLGIHPRYEWGWSRKDGRTLVHRLLSLRTDHTPGLYVDAERCPLTAQAFLGRYVYPQTRDGKTAEDPDDKTHPWADVMAAVRYLVTGLHKKIGLQHFRIGSAPPPPTPPTHVGYGTPRRP